MQQGIRIYFLYTYFRRPPIRRLAAIAAVPLLAASLLATSLPAQSNSTRALSGTVTDQAHKPLTRAVVQLENDDTKAVESFETDRVGHYRFQRLSANTDYTVWARLGQSESRRHAISKFNSRNPVVVDIEVKVP